jgi:hypothetical protein
MKYTNPDVSPYLAAASLRLSGGEGEGSERQNILRRNGKIFLLVEVYLRGGKALGSQEGKVLGNGLCYDEKKDVERGF